MNMIKRKLKVALLLCAGIVLFTISSAQEVKAAGVHTVTFVYGTKMNSQLVADGSFAIIPTDTAVTGYTFLGWSDSAFNVTTDKVILGMYVNNTPYAPATNAFSSVKKVNNNTSAPFLSWWAYASPERGVPGVTCVVRWYNGWNNELWKTEVVPYGTTLPDPADPCVDGYQFVGWEGSWTNITEDRAIKAWYYRGYAVKYYCSICNECMDTQHIRVNEKGTYPPVHSHDGRTFDKWDKSVDCITGDTNVTALYK